MKQLKSYLAVSMALMILGCGGSGGTGSTTGTTTVLSTPRIEAIVRVERNNLKHPSLWTDDQLLDPTNQALKADLLSPTVFGFQDPTNFQTSENYVFQLAAYKEDGSRVVLPATFATTDTTGTYGNLGTNSGSFSVSGNTTTTGQTVIATYNGLTYTAEYDVKQRQSRVIGQVQNKVTGKGIDSAIVTFFDATGLFVGEVTTAEDGTFRASVPQGASSFTVDSHSLAANYYSVFGFGTKTYTAGSADCRAALPGLVVGSQTLTTTIQITPTTSNAPTVDGCSVTN